MALASVKDPVTFNDHGKQLGQSKGLAKIYGYMGIGLLISGIIATVLGYFMQKAVGVPSSTNNTAMTVYAAMLIVSFIVMLIDSFVMASRAASGKNLWAPYIVYTVCMGIFLAGFLITGISFATLGISFGITAVVFALLFCIGWFSKANLNVAAFFFSGLLGIAALGGLVVLILYLINPSIFSSAMFFTYLIISVLVSVFVLIITAVDSYNIRKIIERGGATDNILLFCAFQMYVDFIMILIRVIAIVASIRRN